MLEEYLYHQQPRNRKRFDWRDIAGPVICGIALVYMVTIAVLGLLAR